MLNQAGPGDCQKHGHNLERQQAFGRTEVILRLRLSLVKDHRTTSFRVLSKIHPSTSKLQAGKP